MKQPPLVFDVNLSRETLREVTVHADTVATPRRWITRGQSSDRQPVYSKDGDRYIVVASRGGSPTSPDWYHNLVANGSCVIEVGNDVISVEASMAAGAERDRLYAQHAAIMPQFNDYAKNTTRTIPVVVLTVKE